MSVKNFRGKKKKISIVEIVTTTTALKKCRLYLIFMAAKPVTDPPGHTLYSGGKWLAFFRP